MTSRIWACTVTSRAVVGSSAISTSGSLAIAIAIIARWRMPPENSCGYWRARVVGLRDADQVEQLDGPAAGLPVVDVLVRLDHLGDLVADLVHRVQRGQRVLEDHRELLAPDAALDSSCRAPSSSWPRNFAEPVIVARLRQQAHRGEHRDRLARARLAHDAERSRLRAPSRSTPRTACTRPSSVLNETSEVRELEDRLASLPRSAAALMRFCSAWGRGRRADRRP